MYVHVWMQCLQRPEEDLRSPQVDIQVVLSLPVWLLGVERLSSARAVSALKPWATSPAPIMLILWKELGGPVCFPWVTAKAQISLCMRIMAWLGATLLLWPVWKGTCARSWAIAEEMAARRMCRSGDLHSALVPSLIKEHISLLPNTWKIHCEQMGSNNLHASEGARWAQKTGFCVL